MRTPILTQRFQYYTIIPYRDHTSLNRKEIFVTKKNMAIELSNVDFFEFYDTENRKVKFNQTYNLDLLNKKHFKKKNTKFFYASEDVDNITLEPWRRTKKEFYTIDEKHLKKHYGRAFSCVETHIMERSISVDGDSISVRFYTFNKYRKVNDRYFSKSRNSHGFKINLKTGNVVIYAGSGKTIKIRQNNFKFLKQVMHSFFGGKKMMIVGTTISDVTHPVNIEYDKNFNDDDFNNTLTHLILSKLDQRFILNSLNENEPRDKFFNLILELFVNVNKIKVPNNYQKLLSEWYPTKEYLKKNDNKLIASVLDRMKLKSKGLIKLLHKYPNIDMGRIVQLAKYFGFKDLHKYIPNINEAFFDGRIVSGEIGYEFDSMYSLLNNHYEYDIRDSERKCVLKIINELISEITNVDSNGTFRLGNSIEFSNRAYNSLSNNLSQLNDHINLLQRIRQHLPDVEMRATSMKDFHDEHIELSKIDRTIKKGYSIKYVFDEKLVRRIEEPIYPVINIGTEEQPIFKLDKDATPYYPVILKIDGEYDEEGGHMHHCVASYSNKETSIIVSLREDSPIGHERVTSEFDTRDKSCIQSKYFCNAVPPERFEFALEKLKERIKTYRGSIKSLRKEQIPLVINGVTIIKQEEEPFIDFIQREVQDYRNRV